MEILKDLIGNTFFLSAVISWFFAQFIKIIVEILKKHKFGTRDFILRAVFGTGGMPSSHSASVTGVAISIGIQQGFDSALFAFAILFVFIVIRDATGVRFSAGKQAEAINKLLERDTSTSDIEKLKAVRGHTPLECFVGVMIGVMVALAVYYL